MQIYKTKARKFSGTDFHEVKKKAFGLYSEIKRKSKRLTYVRSAYFNKDKIWIIRNIWFYPYSLAIRNK